MISLQVNGKERSLESEMTLLDYFASKGIDPRAVAAEYNGTVLHREQFEGITLRAGDQLEVVRMIGGGAGSATKASRE